MVSAVRRAAGCVVVRDTASGVRLLVLRVYRNWDFPKGLVEPGEEPLVAALRETREESGIEDLELGWGEQFVETEPYSGNKVARYYLGRTHTEHIVLPVNPALGHPEHHEWRWVSFEEAGRLLPPRLQHVLQWAAAQLTQLF